MPLSPPAESNTHMPSGRYAAGDGAHGGSSGSLFELPVSPGARRLRIGLILLFNLLLLGGAAALVLRYIDKRDAAAAEVVEAGASAEGAVSAVDGGPGPGTVALDGAVAPADPSAGRRDAAVATRPDRAGSADAGLAGDHDSDRGKPGGAGGESARPAAQADAGVPRTSQPGRRTGGTADAGTAASTPTPSRGPDASVGAAPVDEGPVDINVLANKIDLVVRRKQSQLKRCYERAAKTGNPSEPLQGRIDLRFTIQPSGRARSPQVVSNSTGSEVLAQCLVGLVKTWDFPSSGSEELEFVWPFEFQAPQ